MKSLFVTIALSLLPVVAFGAEQYWTQIEADPPLESPSMYLADVMNVSSTVKSVKLKVIIKPGDTVTQLPAPVLLQYVQFDCAKEQVRILASKEFQGEPMLYGVVCSRYLESRAVYTEPWRPVDRELFRHFFRAVCQ
ncbi:hypothetical protein [Geobacter sp. FeAm09]|uniref:hypothetical protein n=1 Tax=Geobacter sp. FeAm09 TaxID=2597769 RepID=UPI00197A840D|nr:hypothetical protein [Geobacter sp. FeAm09]